MALGDGPGRPPGGGKGPGDAYFNWHALPRVKPGEVVRFTYRRAIGAPKWGRDEKTGKVVTPTDAFKEVLILNGGYEGRVHAIDLKKLTAAQREVIFSLFDPRTKKDGKHHIPLVNDVLRRMNPRQEIKNPQSFYAKFVRPFLLTAGDCYRQYYPHRISRVTHVDIKDMHHAPLNRPSGATTRGWNYLAKNPPKVEPTQVKLDRLALLKRQKQQGAGGGAERQRELQQQRLRQQGLIRTKPGSSAKPAVGAKPAQPAKQPTGPTKPKGPKKV